MVTLKQCFVLLALAAALASAAVITDDRFNPHKPSEISDDRNVPLSKIRRDVNSYGREPVVHDHLADDKDIANKEQIREQIRDTVYADADRQTKDFFATHGHCDGPDTETCQNHLCLLASPGCVAYTKDEKHEMSVQTREIMFKVVSTGKCEPTSKNKAYCRSSGYCDIFESLGDEDCQQLNQQDHVQLIRMLRPQPDGSFDFFVQHKAESTSSQNKMVRRKLVRRDKQDKHDSATETIDDQDWIGQPPCRPVMGAGVYCLSPSHAPPALEKRGSSKDLPIGISERWSKREEGHEVRIYDPEHPTIKRALTGFLRADLLRKRSFLSDEGGALDPLPQKFTHLGPVKRSQDRSTDKTVTADVPDFNEPVYQPTRGEVSDFMEYCLSLSKNRSAIQEYVSSVGGDKAQIDRLAKAFSELAHDRKAAQEVMQHIMMERELAESKDEEVKQQQVGRHEKPLEEDDGTRGKK